MRTKLLLVPLVSVALAAAACGDDDEDASATTTSAALTESTSPAAREPVQVTAVDYAFEGLPHEVAAGTTLALHNDSSAEVHELIAYRLPDGEERSAEDLLALPEEEIGALLAGPPNLGLLALPGEDGDAVVGESALAEPGRYLVFCAIPSGAAVDDVQAAIAEAQETDAPPAIPGGPPHFVNGMYGEIEVH